MVSDGSGFVSEKEKTALDVDRRFALFYVIPEQSCPHDNKAPRVDSRKFPL
jgi:hypothetical protein